MLATVIALVAPFVALGWLTSVGARRRGNRPAVALLSGVCFPATWAVWYVRDELLPTGKDD